MLFYTKQYDVYLNIPDDINFSFNDIIETNIFDLETYINNLYIKDHQSLIVLWGIGARIPLTDHRITKLNEFYHGINNPMILVNGTVNNQHSLLDFPMLELVLFRYISKISLRHDRIINLAKTKKFLFASTKDYLTRRYVLQSLINQGLSDQGHIAYKCIVRDLSPQMFDPDSYQIIKTAGGSIESLLPIQGFDEIPDYNSIPEDVIQDTILSIITETYFDAPIHISEKVFNAMMYNHLFIYLGPPHALEYLRSLGFKTFGHVIDETYDTIENAAERLFAVTKSLENFLQQPIETLREIYKDNIDILEHNRKLVQATEIHATVTDAFRSAIAIKQ